MNITLRQLRYFVEIANSRSFSRAAEHLSIAQPALSQNISALEADLDVILFKRHARGVGLSDAGQLLLTESVQLLARADSLKARLAGREVRPSGVVRLSIVGSLAGALMGPLVRAIAQDYPDIELTVREGLSSEVRAQVESGAAHLAVMPSPSELQGMESLPIFEESFMLFGARAAMRRLPPEIPFAQVAALPLAEPDRAHDLRKIIERVANATGHKLDVRYELNSPALLVSVVREGLAYSVMPPSACQDAVTSKAIVGQRVVTPELTRMQAIVWPRDRPLGLAATAVRCTLIDVVHRLLQEGQLQGRIASASASHKKN
ncbi:transcriptional regulator, LysR family [Variovorax sp. YR266]|uniref:LysR family transcriptional regulator n=1 Tax=Variovorax sp. YR266 TaxID=1884386 RepID=UPI000895F9D5|nr:LysR family transcriptional regulator [Variovorax sp. YR266]SDY34603.1 transcriptional regulator, LysR family [Variovorax sp. YR266]